MRRQPNAYETAKYIIETAEAWASSHSMTREVAMTHIVEMVAAGQIKPYYCYAELCYQLGDEPKNGVRKEIWKSLSQVPAVGDGELRKELH